jgi:serine protease
MQRSHLSAALAALAFTAAACSDSSGVTVQPDLDAVPVARAAAAAQADVMPGEVIVKLRDGADIAEVSRAHGLALGEKGYKNAFSVLHGNAGSERALAAALRADSRVEYAEPNYLRHVYSINPKLWAFFNPGGLNLKYTSGSSSGQFLPASYASKLDGDVDNIEGIGAGGTDVVIGSIDTGVSMTHPEFTGRLIAGKDWYNNDANPEDDDGHGSHTTGIMAGTTVGIAGVSGAAAHVKVYVQKVCGRRGCPTTAIVSAIRAAADYPGMVAMNISIGGAGLAQSEADAIAYATGKNVLVIASAGNSNVATVDCPACDPNAISVAATDWSDKRAPYSSYGSGLDISAPGGSCYSNTTEDGCIYSAFKSGTYAYEQGTSMASPMVTGAAGVVASKTGLRGAALRSRLLSSVDDLGTSGYDTTFGAGRLNVYRAITGTSLGTGL